METARVTTQPENKTWVKEVEACSKNKKQLKRQTTIEDFTSSVIVSTQETRAAKLREQE